MTTIVTRLYADEATANQVGVQLMDNHFRKTMISVITGGGDAAAEMAAAKVPAAARDAYASGLQQGNALLVVRAPFGGAETANQIVDATSSIDIGDVPQSNYIRTDMSADLSTKILKDHPRFMSSGMYPSLRRGRSMIAMLFGKPLLKKRVKLNTALYRGTKFWANFPIPHLSGRTPNMNTTLYRGTKFWANWPIPHLAKSEKDPSLY